MSIYNCHKQQPQPWMSYISPNKIVYPGECCPALLTDLAHLLPFQVISNGAYTKMEYTLYGEDSWTEITLPVTTVMTDGFFIHSYNGEPLASELPCGVYEFRLTAGETWYFEPIMIEDFTITENALSVRDELMTPFKITEQLADTTPLIAPCDRILPFMFRTSNATSGTVTVTMVDSDGAETALTITVHTGVIDGKTYYWHRGECLYPFLTCGKYYLKIVDGANTYYSVPFVPECGISDIPDGYQPMRDFNGCVMRDADGAILYEECSAIPAEFTVRFGYLYNYPAVVDARNICAAGWHVPTEVESQTLYDYCGSTGDDFVNKLCVANFMTLSGMIAAYPAIPVEDLQLYVDEFNAPITNEFNFNMRSSGSRQLTTPGDFQGTGIAAVFHLSDLPEFPDYTKHVFFNTIKNLSNPGWVVTPFGKAGMSLRPLKDSTILTHGQSGTYVGNDGKVYRTICIGTQEWLADNLCETLYRDGSPIPEVTDAATWAALTTGARCSYDNDESNAFTI